MRIYVRVCVCVCVCVCVHACVCECARICPVVQTARVCFLRDYVSAVLHEDVLGFRVILMHICVYFVFFYRSFSQNGVTRVYKLDEDEEHISPHITTFFCL